MPNVFAQRLADRSRSAASDSDYTLFHSLLVESEALFKLATLFFVYSLDPEPDRHQYRLEHTLVRADGIGSWFTVLQDVTSGPASVFLNEDAVALRNEITVKVAADAWQHQCVAKLLAAMVAVEVQPNVSPTGKLQLLSWFAEFPKLRNKTRGHGAPLPGKVTPGIPELQLSIQLLRDNLSLLHLPWCYIHRYLAGNYRVTTIANGPAIEGFRPSAEDIIEPGVHVLLERPRKLSLLRSDQDLLDFYVPNGGCTSTSFEMLSYLSDDRLACDLNYYSSPVGSLPGSESQGLGELRPQGRCFTNIPSGPTDYIARPHLENELHGLLIDDRRPIVTLRGRGGIGKTSLALKVIPTLFESDRYEAVVWFSARDVDLMETGPKQVRADVISEGDVARSYANMVLDKAKLSQKAFAAKEFFEAQLGKSEVGATLFVFDNFETMYNPQAMFKWIDTFLRLPNKALLTTRLRDFKGDYPVEVRGMEDIEAMQLVEQTARVLGIWDSLESSTVRGILEESAGHPYIIKILLGQIARSGKATDITRVLATSEDVLDALFERTYRVLTPCAQRTLMTLSGWSSAVPRTALEAVLQGSIGMRLEVEEAIEELIQYSLAEVKVSEGDGMEFVDLPLVARIFGRSKLKLSPAKAAIEVDIEVLQMFGVTKVSHGHAEAGMRVRRFLAEVSKKCASGASYDDFEPLVRMMCRAYNPGWLLLAQWHLEDRSKGGHAKAREALEAYLILDNSSAEAATAWRMLSEVCSLSNDLLGSVHASIERARLCDVQFYELSSTASFLNRLLKDQKIAVRMDEKQVLAKRVLTAMDSRRREADATDFSRMAWLAYHVDDVELTKEYVWMGLERDSSNYHCQNLALKLGLV